MAEDEGKKIEITLLTDVKVDNDTVGIKGEVHKFGVGIAAMLVNNGLALEGKQKVDLSVDDKRRLDLRKGKANE